MELKWSAIALDGVVVVVADDFVADDHKLGPLISADDLVAMDQFEVLLISSWP